MGRHTGALPAEYPSSRGNMLRQLAGLLDECERKDLPLADVYIVVQTRALVGVQTQTVDATRQWARLLNLPAPALTKASRRLDNRPGYASDQYDDQHAGFRVYLGPRLSEQDLQDLQALQAEVPA